MKFILLQHVEANVEFIFLRKYCSRERTLLASLYEIYTLNIVMCQDTCGQICLEFGLMLNKLQFESCLDDLAVHLR